MDLCVRKADLKIDKHVIIETLFHHLTPESNEERFEWLYTKNPLGPAVVWLGVDEKSGTVFGVASAFPRRMFINGNLEKGWVLGDFCIHEQYRSLGPAIKLQRACLAAIGSGHSSIWYDFPSSSMMAIYQRLRVPFSKISVLRFAKPIRVDRKVRTYIKNPFLAAGVTSLANGALKQLRRANAPKQKDVTVSVHPDECGEEFTRLTAEIGSKQALCVERSSAYLNWRYIRNPLCRYELITASKGHSLRAYAVCRRTNEDMTVVDVCGYEDATVIQALLHYITERSWDQGMMTLSIPLAQNHPWCSMFQQLGFRVRDSCPFVLGVNGVHQPDVSERWFVGDGDRDG